MINKQIDQYFISKRDIQRKEKNNPLLKAKLEKLYNKFYGNKNTNSANDLSFHDYKTFKKNYIDTKVISSSLIKASPLTAISYKIFALKNKSIWRYRLKKIYSQFSKHKDNQNNKNKTKNQKKKELNKYQKKALKIKKKNLKKNSFNFISVNPILLKTNFWKYLQYRNFNFNLKQKVRKLNLNIKREILFNPFISLKNKEIKLTNLYRGKKEGEIEKSGFQSEKNFITKYLQNYQRIYLFNQIKDNLYLSTIQNLKVRQKNLENSIITLDIWKDFWKDILDIKENVNSNIYERQKKYHDLALELKFKEISKDNKEITSNSVYNKLKNEVYGEDFDSFMSDVSFRKDFFAKISKYNRWKMFEQNEFIKKYSIYEDFKLITFLNMILYFQGWKKALQNYSLNLKRKLKEIILNFKENNFTKLVFKNINSTKFMNSSSIKYKNIQKLYAKTSILNYYLKFLSISKKLLKKRKLFNNSEKNIWTNSLILTTIKLDFIYISSLCSLRGYYNIYYSLHIGKKIKYNILNIVLLNKSLKQFIRLIQEFRLLRKIKLFLLTSEESFLHTLRIYIINFFIVKPNITVDVASVDLPFIKWLFFRKQKDIQFILIFGNVWSKKITTRNIKYLMDIGVLWIAIIALSRRYETYRVLNEMTDLKKIIFILNILNLMILEKEKVIYERTSKQIELSPYSSEGQNLTKIVSNNLC